MRPIRLRAHTLMLWVSILRRLPTCQPMRVKSLYTPKSLYTQSSNLVLNYLHGGLELCRLTGNMLLRNFVCLFSARIDKDELEPGQDCIRYPLSMTLYHKASRVTHISPIWIIDNSRIIFICLIPTRLILSCRGRGSRNLFFSLSLPQFNLFNSEFPQNESNHEN